MLYFLPDNKSGVVAYLGSGYENFPLPGYSCRHLAGGRHSRNPLRELLNDWRNLLPVAGLVLLAIASVVMWIRRRPSGTPDIEHERRAYVNRIGRIVEGQVLDVVDHGHGKTAAEDVAAREKERAAFFAKRRAKAYSNGAQVLLYYCYSISGVTYETAQDVTGLEERLLLTQVAAGQVASVKYDPSNPSNSILLADDWSGLH